MYPYEIERELDPPDKDRRGGRNPKWSFPLDSLDEGDAIKLSMSRAEAKDRIFAVRAHVQREQKKLGKKFSVYQSREGITIWRRYEV